MGKFTFRHLSFNSNSCPFTNYHSLQQIKSPAYHQDAQGKILLTTNIY